MITVSVVVPVFNAEQHIGKCVESLVGQTYENIEILLVNDGSSDGSLSMCKKYAEKDKRIRVIDKQNGGVSSARNKGLEVFSGDYVMFVDADDRIEQDAIETLVRVALDNDSDVVLFEYVIDRLNGQSIICRHTALEGNITVQKAVYYTITPINRFVWSKIFKREAVEGLRFDETIHFGEDTLFACQAISKGEKAYFCAKPLYRYLQTEGSATRKSFFNKRLLSGRKAYEKLIELCEEKYPTLVNCAISNYLEIVMVTIMEMFKEKEENRENIKLYASLVREKFKKVVFSKACPKTTKIKALLCSISPSLMAKIRRYGKEL